MNQANINAGRNDRPVSRRAESIHGLCANCRYASLRIRTDGATDLVCTLPQGAKHSPCVLVHPVEEDAV